MKKLLIAASATACALGAFADGISSGTDFESLQAGTVLNVDAGDDGTLATDGVAKMWYTSDKTGLDATVTAYGEAATPENRPAKFASAANTKYLNIESTSAPLYRTVNAMSEDKLDSATKVNMGEVYIDTLVQFTAGDPEMAAEEAGAKLALWVCGNDADGNPAAATNFMVKAGQIQADGSIKATDYTMQVSGVTFKKDEWVRLTVKTIGKIGSAKIGEADVEYAGFVVFANGNMLTPVASSAPIAVESANYQNSVGDDYAAGVMPSLVLKSQANGAKLAAVGFSGTGAIDDVTFTSTAPDFAEDALKYKVTFGDNVTSVKCGENSLTSGNFYDVGAELTFTAVVADGYAAKWSTNGVVVATGSSVGLTLVKGDVLNVTAFQPAATVNGVAYETFADALDGAANGGTVVLETEVTLGANDGITVVKGGSIVLDLNGKVIDGSAIEGDVISVYGNLTVCDSKGTGKIVAKKRTYDTDEYSAIYVASSAMLTVEGGYINGDVFAEGENVSLVGGFFTMYNSDVKTQNWPIANGKVVLASVTVEGVTYYPVGVASTVKPVAPGSNSVVEAESADKAAEMVEITVPDDVVAGLNDATEQKNYKTNFVVTAKAVEGQTGKYTVEVVLRKEIEAAIEEKATEAAEAGLAEVLDPTSDSNEVTVTGVINGFYYSVEHGTTLGGMVEEERTMATGGSVKLTFPKNAADTAHFYKVKVNLGPNQ